MYNYSVSDRIKDYKVNLQEKSHQDLTEMAKSMNISKKRLCEVLIAIGKKFVGTSKGMLGVFFDPRTKIKIYFEDDNRKEIEF